MKKSLGLMIATVALTVLCVTPVFATESNLDAEGQLLADKMIGYNNAVSTLAAYDANCGGSAAASMHALLANNGHDVFMSNSAECLNYIDYLNACLGNAIEAERVAKGNVGALTDLVKVNTSYKAQLDAAVIEYNNAIANTAAARVAIDNAKAYFNALNAQFAADGNAQKAAHTAGHN